MLPVQGLRAARDFLRWDVFDVGGDPPAISRGVFHAAQAYRPYGQPRTIESGSQIIVQVAPIPGVPFPRGSEGGPVREKSQGLPC